MKQVERPAPVLVAARNYGFNGLADADARIDSRIPQLIESAQDVVVPKVGNEKRSQRSSMTSPVRSERNMWRSRR